MSDKGSISYSGSVKSRSRTGSAAIKESSTVEGAEEVEDTRAKTGLGVGKATYFLVAQMAGAGFLALPRAFADAGWIGMVLMFLFCISIGFASSKLAKSWLMMEKRYPEYRKPVRQPYQEMAFRATGVFGRRLSLMLLFITLIGSGIVYIILIAGLLESIIPSLSLCEWALVVVAILLPFCYLGSPKDFWQASVFAVVSTVLAIVIIIIKIFLDYAGEVTYPPTQHPNPTVSSFSLGFGAILFAFGGSPIFPTIQNDMKDRSQFWKCIIIAFIVILCLYFPVALFGYIYIGDAVNSNVILSLKSGPLITVAIVFEVFNLLGTFIIALNPVFQALEEMLHIPSTFNLKRIGIRTGIILGQLFVGLAFPDFGLILNLIGGSSTCLLSFILPPLMYMKLIDDKEHQDGSQSEIPTWQRLYLWEIIVIGSIGGISATVSALVGLLNPDSFSASCFATFG